MQQWNCGTSTEAESVAKTDGVEGSGEQRRRVRVREVTIYGRGDQRED